MVRLIFMDSLCEANREKISCWPQKICRCGPSPRPAWNQCNRNQAEEECSVLKEHVFIEIWSWRRWWFGGFGWERNSRMNWSSHMFLAEEYSLTSVCFKLHYLIPCWIIRCLERHIDIWVFFEFCAFRCRIAGVKRYSRLKCRYHIIFTCLRCHFTEHHLHPSLYGGYHQLNWLLKIIHPREPLVCVLLPCIGGIAQNYSIHSKIYQTWKTNKDHSYYIYGPKLFVLWSEKPRNAINVAFAFQSIALRFAAHRMYLSMLEGHVHSVWEMAEMELLDKTWPTSLETPHCLLVTMTLPSTDRWVRFSIIFVDIDRLRMVLGRNRR